MTVKLQSLDTQQRGLLEQAAEWRLISLLFECPTQGWKEQIVALALEISDKDLQSAARYSQSEATEALYHSIFGPGGPAPPREVSYRDSVQLGYLVAELDAFYRSFSFFPAATEVLDHVSVEAGFMGYMKLKEAYALASSKPEDASITAEAAGRFLEDHLSFIAQPLAAALRDLGVEYLSLAGEALLRRSGAPHRTSPLQESALPILDESLFDCGPQ